MVDTNILTADFLLEAFGMIWNQRGWLLLSIILCLLFPSSSGEGTFGVKSGLHFTPESRATNIDGSIPTYKNPYAPIESRVDDLLPRMSLAEKTAQLYECDSLVLFQSH